MPQSADQVGDRSVAQLLRETAARLPGREARREAELLLEAALGVDRAWLFSHADDLLPGAEQAGFTRLLERRAAGEPIAYILGRAGFWTLDLRVTPATLIPRPETELLVEVALELLPSAQACQLLDLGTGSGAIALALARERPGCSVVAVDFSAEALAVACANAERNSVGNVLFRRGDWFEPVAGERFELIVSNPPYIASDDAHLQRGDLCFEPALALASGPDGLDAIRRIVAQAPAHLEAGGWLLLEHGLEQGRAVRALLRGAGFEQVETRRDLEARERISLGRAPTASH